MPLDRFIINFNSEPIDQYSQYSQKPPIEHGQAIFGDIGDIEHRVENENQGAASVVPANIRAALELGGYEHDLIDWSPSVCRAFLDALVEEWREFRVNGWNGLAVPETWPVEFIDAVQSIYVESMQDQAQGVR